MNEVFLVGKIISDIEFKFIIDSKNTAISKFKMETISDKQIIDVKAYNEVADYTYQVLEQGTTLGIRGYFNSKEIVIEEFEKISLFYWHKQIKNCIIKKYWYYGLISAKIKLLISKEIVRVVNIKKLLIGHVR